jgi:hypothetical protein
MSERPKTPFEVAAEMLRNSNPKKIMEEMSEKSPGLDDDIRDVGDDPEPSR